MLGCNLSELREDGGLEVGNLGNGLDHKVHGRKVVHVQTRSNARTNGVGSFLSKALLGNIFLKELV